MHSNVGSIFFKCTIEYLQGVDNILIIFSEDIEFIKQEADAISMRSSYLTSDEKPSERRSISLQSPAGSVKRSLEIDIDSEDENRYGELSL